MIKNASFDYEIVCNPEARGALLIKMPSEFFCEKDAIIVEPFLLNLKSKNGDLSERYRSNKLKLKPNYLRKRVEISYILAHE